MRARELGLVAGLVGVMTWAGAAAAAEIQWYGQAAFKITTDGGKVIVLQPGDTMDF